MNTATPRYTTLPEEFPFVDTGCSYAPACLSCPFEECRFDHADPPRRERDVKIIALRAQGRKVREIVALLDVPPRTVGRVLANERKNNGP